jgi:PadR family transcriptional regulator PadR
MGSERPVFCDQKHHTMDRFLGVCLLLLVNRKPDYGYALMDNLQEFGFSDLNIGAVYRTLRKLESHNLVSSTWKAAVQGPKRREYQITRQGEEELSRWIDMLRDRKHKLAAVIDAYEKLE